MSLLHGTFCLPAKTCYRHELAFTAGETALTLAAGSGEQETAELLVQHSADVSRSRPGGAQPIHTAAASGVVSASCIADSISGAACYTGLGSLLLGIRA